jgi:hypothetical protein
MRQSNPRHYWIQVVDLNDEIVKQYRVFITPQSAQDKADYEAKQSNVNVVWIIDGKARTLNPNEPVSLDNPIVPRHKEILNRVEPRPFTEDGKQAIPVSTLAVVKEKTITGRLLRNEFVKTKTWASKL